MSDNNPKYNEKYNHMGVTPNELYMRQNGMCWLEFIKYDVDGESITEDLYCTDGNDYVLTRNMLNPTFECVQCMSSFTLKGEREMVKKIEDTKGFMSILMNLLVYIHSLKKKDDNIALNMDIDTFLKIEKFIEENTMYSNEVPPVRNNGVVRMLFGISVNIVNKLPTGKIIVDPYKKEFTL